MRILHVASGLGVGGAERQLVLLSRELQRRGHRVLIYALNEHLALAPGLGGCGVEVIADQKRMRLDPIVLARLRRTARAWGAELAHGWLYDGNVYARLALLGMGIPVINSERSDNYALNWLQRLGYALTRGAQTALIANTHAGLNFAARLHRVPTERAHVVWNGIDLAAAKRDARGAPALRAACWPGQNIRLACHVASVTPPKDHLLALDTAAELVQRDDRWRFLFVGNVGAATEYRRSVERKVQSLHLQEVTQFTGERLNAIAYIAASDVLFSTSRLEGFPNVVLEAMACGVPVVSTEYSDIRRILPLPWQVVAPREPALLADAIERAHDERESVASAQRDWVEEYATAAQAAGTLESVYATYAVLRR